VQQEVAFRRLARYRHLCQDAEDGSHDLPKDSVCSTPLFNSI